MTGIVFHSMEGSSYLWSMMQIAAEKGVPFELKILALHSPEHLKMHPFGKMPVMQHGDVFLYESLAIAHYIDKAFDGPVLQPSDALGQAEVLRWISIVNAYVFPVMNRFFKERIVKPSWKFDVDTAFVESAIEPLKLQVRLINEAVSKDSFLVGDRLTLADCFLFPNFLFYSLTPEGAALIADAKGATAWLKRMQARPSYAGSIMDRNYHEVSQLAAALYQTPPSTLSTTPVV